MDNGQALGNPWTTHQAAGDFDLTGLDELALTDAATTATAAGRFRRNGTRLHWHDGTASRQVVLTDSAPVSNAAIVPAAVSGTPTQHGLFRENVVKGWVQCNFAGTIADSFNVSSITDHGVGDTTVTWDRDFANATYAYSLNVEWDGSGSGSDNPTIFLRTGTQAVGSMRVGVVNATAAAVDVTAQSFSAIGDQ